MPPSINRSYAAIIFSCLSATFPSISTSVTATAIATSVSIPQIYVVGGVAAPPHPYTSAYSQSDKSFSRANIDAIIARHPTLILQVAAEEVTKDEDELVSRLLLAQQAINGYTESSAVAHDIDYDDGSDVGYADDIDIPALPHGSELDTTSKNKLFKRGILVDGGKQHLASSTLRLKQAKREEVSARMVAPENLNKRNNINNNNNGPSPIAKASPGFTVPGKSLASPGFTSIKSTKVVVIDCATDDKTVKIPTSLPFDLDLFGRTFDGSDISISTNGYIRLGEEGHYSGDDTANPAAFPSKTLGTYMLYPNWDDLSLPESSVIPYPYSVSYTFTSNMVIFDWKVVPVGIDISNNAVHPTKGLVHFQTIYRTDSPGKIEFSYLEDSDPEQMDGEYATIGVQSDKGAYKWSSFQKGSIHPGLSLVLNTVTGQVEVIN